MNENNKAHGEDRERRNDMQNNPGYNGNINDPDSRSHSRDNDGMHAGGSDGSSYRRQPENSGQYGSKKGSYWEEKGSDRQPGVGSRMNEESLNKKR